MLQAATAAAMKKGSPSHNGAMGFLIGRDEATRTPDPYVPNVVRYQLRYIPMHNPFCWGFAAAKVTIIVENCKPNVATLCEKPTFCRLFVPEG